METAKPKKSSFINGAIASEFIGNAIAKHQSKTTIGAHNIFLGQVRAVEIDGKKVSKNEFLQIYLKNNNDPKYDQKSLDEYMELFKKFKLNKAETIAFYNLPILSSILEWYRNPKLQLQRLLA